MYAPISSFHAVAMVSMASPGSYHLSPTRTLCSDALAMVNSMPERVDPVSRASWELPPRASDAWSSTSDLVTCTPPRITSSSQGLPVRSTTCPSELISALADQSDTR